MAASGYRDLVRLGRAEFLAASAPAALVRLPVGEPGVESGASTLTLDEDSTDATLPSRLAEHGPPPLEVFPLAKKAGASFPDRITVGRTSNNDIVLADHSVSRLHGYLRRLASGWVVADAGSKNGSWLRGAKLDPRRELALTSGSIVRFGDLELTFYLAADLYLVLGGA